MTEDSGLERWRLVLGTGGTRLGGLEGDAAGQGAALDWLYGRDEGLGRRGIRRGSPTSGDAGEGRGGDESRRREGGTGPSALSTFDWLDEVHRLFPRETIERLERDAVEKYQIQEILTDPQVLQRVEPSAAMLKAVLRTKHLMNPDVLRLARGIVEKVVRELMEKMAREVRQAFSGPRSRRPSQMRQARNFDFRRTLRANLAHYQPDTKQVLIETPLFVSRSRRHLERWQVILLVDQSGSMVDSVIHSAVTAACLYGLPGIRSHLVAFDSNVVDLTSDVDDPVELLMKVNLGGGTDIARAVRYGGQLVENPRRTIMVIISDFFEGGDEYSLVRSVRELVQQGTHVLGLAALDEQANPAYDRAMGQRLADVGAHMGAMTPGELAAFVAEKVGR